jgi:hypothetical protein
VSQAREKLHSAREALNPVLGRRGVTTEVELDECVRTLEDFKNVLFAPKLTREEIMDLRVILDEVIARIKNRPRKEP